MNIQNNNQNLAFNGLGENVLKGLYKRKNALTAEEKKLEHQRGLFAGLDAKKRGVDECREIIIRETLAGNFDYVKGFNEAIGKDMAKKAYSTIGK